MSTGEVTIAIRESPPSPARRELVFQEGSIETVAAMLTFLTGFFRERGRQTFLRNLGDGYEVVTVEFPQPPERLEPEGASSTKPGAGDIPSSPRRDTCACGRPKPVVWPRCAWCQAQQPLDAQPGVA